MALRDYLRRLTTAVLTSTLILTSEFDPLQSWHLPPRNKQRNVYITAFGPWSHNNRNASEDFAIYLSVLGYDTEVLPVDFEEAPKRLIQIIEEKKPRTIISLGEGAAFGNYFEVNVIAKNLMYGTDVAQQTYVGTIDSNLPNILPLPQNNLSELVSKFAHAGIRYNLSDDTGTYVCNVLLFRGLEATSDSSTRIYFFHVPRDIYSNKDKRHNLEMAIEALAH